MHWQERPALSFALMVIACEALKPIGADDRINGLLGRPAYPRGRAPARSGLISAIVSMAVFSSAPRLGLRGETEGARSARSRGGRSRCGLDSRRVLASGDP
jgi:hypothetical protein